MAIKITQDKYRKRDIFHRKEIDSDGNIIRDTVFCIRVEVFKESINYQQNGENKTAVVKRYIPFDSNGHVIPKIASYVNFIRSGKSPESRRSMCRAILLYYMWCEMMYIDPEKINYAEAEMYVNFLQGIDVDSENKHINCASMRKYKTCMSYLGELRKYFSIMKIKNAEFNIPVGDRTKTIKSSDPRHHSKRVPRTLAHSLKPESSVDKKTPPPHFTPDQVRALLKEIIAAKDASTYLATVLCYCYGLRPDECLGLTLEDVKAEGGDSKEYYLLLRNRLTDNGRYCKGLMHPTLTHPYDSDAYKKSFWKIYISKDHYDLIMKYYRQTRNVSFRQLKEIKKNTYADSVEGHRENYYIILNKVGRGMMLYSFNHMLKKYLTKCGIPVDVETKNTGCAHKLRHSFAMFHALYCANRKSQLELMAMMRHSCLASTAIYFTTTAEEEKKLRQDFEAELPSLIPEFKIAAS